MNREPTQSERLLDDVREEIRRRKTTLHKAALEMGCNYITVYYALNPSKRVLRRSGPPRFSYELGKKFEEFLKDKRAK